MKVYVVVEDWSCDFESGESIVAFSTMEKARAYMNNRIEEIQQEYDYDTTEITETYGDFYNEGYYRENHTSIRIEEVDIDKEV